MSVTDGIGQTPCSFEHYLVSDIFVAEALNFVDDSIDVCTHYIS